MSYPRLERIGSARYELAGYVAGYVRGVIEQWLLVAPDANPAMLEMFRDRNQLPHRDLVPWAGEFAGKYLTAATQLLHMTRDERLRAYVERFVDTLVALQAADGYLGPWPTGWELSGRAPQYPEGGTWDAWGHYHIMVGLLLWHTETGAERALSCASRIGDLFCNQFLGDRAPRLVDTGMTEMNLAPVHALCLLYKETGTRRYLDLSLQLVAEFGARGADGQPLAGDYLEAPLAGPEFYQTPKPRWESLHPIMALAELYDITGDARLRESFALLWWSIARLDRHNNGGFSSGEQAQGSPYHQGAIETCCTIAWMALSVEMLRLTGDSVVADELELSTLNAVTGMHSPTGRWATYNTPMDGVRKASGQDIVFQARAGSPELNCCSVNAARGFGLIGDWALMAAGDGLALNWYGPGRVAATLPSGVEVVLAQETAYPRDGVVALRVTPSQPVEFTLHLRIPHWSARTVVAVHGQPVPGVQPGSYLALHRQWAAGDMVQIELDMSLHYWTGEAPLAGLTSVFRGPLLLTYDQRHNVDDSGEVPVLEAAGLAVTPISVEDWLAPFLLLEAPADGGRSVRLCDFGSAGQGGSPYRSWLPVRGVTATAFSRITPLRSARAPG